MPKKEGDELRYHFAKPRMGAMDRAKAIVGSWVIGHLSPEQTARVGEFFREINKGKLPVWFIDMAVKWPGIVYWLERRPELGAWGRERAIRSLSDGRPECVWLRKWAKSKFLSGEEADYLADLSLTYTDERLGIKGEIGLAQVLIQREDLTWIRLEKLLSGWAHDEEAQRTLMAQAFENENYEVFAEGLTAWARSQPGKEKYDGLWFGFRIFGITKEMLKSDHDFGKAREQIKTYPNATKRAAIFSKELGLLGAADVGDFVGAPKDIFTPWLTSERGAEDEWLNSLEREDRVRVIQWLGELGRLEAKRKRSDKMEPKTENTARLHQGGLRITGAKAKNRGT